MLPCKTKKKPFYSQKRVTNTIVRQTNKTLEKATQKVKAEVITRRRACALLALKNQKDLPDFLFNFEATELVSETVTQIAHDLINNHIISVQQGPRICVRYFLLFPQIITCYQKKTDKVSVYFSIFYDRKKQ